MPLPYYPRVSDTRALLRSLRRSRAVFAAELERVDAVWLFGPNPLALAFALVALHRRVPVVLGIRQDFPRYVANRFPGRHGTLVAGHVLERAFRLLARRCATVVVGASLERTFAGRGAPVLSVGFSQIGRTDLVAIEKAQAKSWDGELRLLSVGRLDPEKNPTMLADVLALLRAGDPRWHLEVVGEGSMRETLIDRARALGVADSLSLSGYIAAGEPLWARYRTAHAFLHVSLTEGLPSVLFEAQAAGLPIVATDVGGVETVIEDGVTGLLVPPVDAPAIVAALERIASDAELRHSLVSASLESVARRTMDGELNRVAAFIERHAVGR